jgi:hypothetical protein
MNNRLREITQEQLAILIKMGLDSINHKNMFSRIFTVNDIINKTSYDGVSLILEFKDTKIVVSVADNIYQKINAKKVDEYTNIINSPLADQFKYHVYINDHCDNLFLFIHGLERKAFKGAVENKIMYYNEKIELCYIHEGFHFNNFFENKYSISEFYVGYDFDSEYKPIGKLFVGNRRGLYDGIADKYNAKFRTYYNEFNLNDELLLLKHYLLMDSLETFDDVFTQFHGPLQKPLDLELLKSQFELADMILFNQ